MGMTPIQVISLILMILLALYLAIMVLVTTQIGHFLGQMKRCLLGISIILSERKEVFLSIVDRFENMGVSFRGSDIAIFDQVRALKIDHLKADEASAVSSLLREAESRLRYLAGKNPWAVKDPGYQELCSTLEGLLANYRQSLVVYNRELIGYNYWVKVPLCHWVPYLLGLRVREKLN